MTIKDFDGNVDAQYLQAMAQMLQDLKETSYQMMNLKKDSIVLDVGCGPGVDAYNISQILSAEGRIIGLDNDPQMIKEAENNYNESNLEFVPGDVKNLPYPDEFFDAVRAERLFQVLPEEFDHTEVLQEMMRVTKNGGAIVLADADWGSASVGYDDYELTNRLLHFFANVCRPNGFSGREFLGLMKRNGLEVVDMESQPVITLDFHETVFGEWLTREALEHDVATPEEMDAWNKDLHEKSEKGEFYSCINMVMVAGIK
ncbi:MAG: methyltransferase domain-containing protein [Methanobacteriaceae archaeon]|jgi:ubiquinone/menaquinone biosynthesis C-methylase UbiE|nr:methyltransferase domain-containing protein [Methanobacteriaceae archaeon]MDO9627726.1 methyltransferase domain-containing protein [Methanobacteriaceae archaeon]